VEILWDEWTEQTYQVVFLLTGTAITYSRPEIEKPKTGPDSQKFFERGIWCTNSRVSLVTVDGGVFDKTT
jgi:hypothetical protein